MSIASLKMKVFAMGIEYFYWNFLLKWQYDIDVALTLPVYSLYSGSWKVQS